MLRALAEAGAVLGREDYLSAARRNAAFVLGHLRGTGRGVAPAALVQGRAGQVQRLPGGLRLLRRRAAGPLRGHLRPPLVRGGAGPGADHCGAVRGRGGGRVLRHQRRPRDPPHPPQGSVRQRHPGRQLGGGGRPPAARRVHRRGGLSGASGALPLRPGGARRAASERPSGACSPRWTSPSARCRRWPWWATRPGPIRAISWQRFTPATIPTGCWRCARLGRRGTPCRGDPAPGGADGDRGPGDGLRLPALRLPPPGDHPGGPTQPAGQPPDSQLRRRAGPALWGSGRAGGSRRSAGARLRQRSTPWRTIRAWYSLKRAASGGRWAMK